MDKEIGAMLSISNDLAEVIVKRLTPHLRFGVSEVLVLGTVQSELMYFLHSLLKKSDLMTKAHEVDPSEEFDTHQFEGENPSQAVGVDLSKPGSDRTPEWLSKVFPPKPDVGTYGGSINGDGVWIDDNGRPHFRGADGWIEVRSFPPGINGGALVEVEYGGGTVSMSRAQGVLWGRTKRFRFL